jgi:hypothetical protein
MEVSRSMVASRSESHVTPHIVWGADPADTKYGFEDEVRFHCYLVCGS